MRTSGRTIANRPQKVKNTLDSIPLAAAVVARIVVGQIRSRSPPHAMIVSLFFFFTAALARLQGFDASEELRVSRGVDPIFGGGHDQAFLTRYR